MPDPETNIVERATKECEQIFERMRQNCEQALEIIRDIYLDDLKAECFPLSNCFHSKAHAGRTIFEYIEVYYNNQRLHSGLGYKSPHQYESGYQPGKGTTFSKEKVTATLCAEGGAKVRRANEINGGKPVGRGRLCRLATLTVA